MSSTRILIKECLNKDEWDAAVLSSKVGHPLQLWGWGELKASSGWGVIRLLLNDGDKTIGGMQVLTKKTPIGVFGYAPRGPFLGDESSLETALKAVNPELQSRGLIGLKIEPELKVMPDMELPYSRSTNRVLMSRTQVINLNCSSEEVTSSMRSKTRQYIRQANNNGLVYEILGASEGLEEVLAVYKDTARRAKFALHNDDYYVTLRSKMSTNSIIFKATYEDRIVAFLWLIITPHCAFELYGGQTVEGGGLKANYGLKYFAIDYCQKSGLKKYDMNGRLTSGIDQFKAGFGGEETDYIGCLSFSYSLKFRLLEQLIPFIKGLHQQARRRLGA